MSITQEQFDALKPGDRVELSPPWVGTVVGVLNGMVWVASLANMAYPYDPKQIVAIIPPAPQPVAWMNFYANATDGYWGDRADESREYADNYAGDDRTHVITIYSDGTTTTEAVS